ncbi:hypothetical protein OGAPHI_000296 [Ogataea philodendri]|uniref:Protein Zds1 C-terminal domain-containing protein n=1 Tax=Ogataea philodendri TaxID=1378263 RepID=A0A9P8PG06_9ASCO|nr:uncharacterized protein OGAPHI_000296 [Ogataea philodendri]KAH3671593.1 hypothetical protein OGAPHI_000296 [Ogataea philodendri]
METRNVSKGSKGSRKSTQEELLAASHAVEQELNAVKALKRLSIGNSLNYDPDLPFNEAEKQDFDIIDIHNDKENETPSADDDLDQENVILDSNKFMWVPATAHPQLAPDKFRKHVQATVDEITSKLQRSSSSRSSLSYESRDPGSNSEWSTEPQISEHGLGRKPSIKQLTAELASLSQMAGLDDTDAVTLARTLSSSSRRIKENLDFESSLTRASSTSSAESDLSTPGTQLKRSKWTRYRKGSKSSRSSPNTSPNLTRSEPSPFSATKTETTPFSANYRPESLPPAAGKVPKSSLPPVPVEKNSPLPPLPTEKSPPAPASPVKSPPSTPDNHEERKSGRKSSWTWLGGKDKERDKYESKTEKERSPPNHTRNRHGTAVDVSPVESPQSILPSPPHEPEKEKEKEKKSLSGFFKLKKDKIKPLEKSTITELSSDSDNESITDKRLVNYRKKKEGVQTESELPVQQPRPSLERNEASPEDSPINAVSETIKQTLMSQKRNQKPNQPLKMTDSAFGFPLPPISPSTLVMLNHRYPIHVERAVYRLSHLKLSDPKRPLYQQVLLSNFMYAYLNLVNHTLFLQQQQEEILTQQQQVDEDQFGESVDEYAFNDVYGSGYNEELVYEH